MRVLFRRSQRDNRRGEGKRILSVSVLSLPSVIGILFLFTFVFSVLFSAESVLAKTEKVQVELNGEKTNYSSSDQKVLLDGKKISTKRIPSVKINSTWMVSLTEVFQDGLGCLITYDEAAHLVALTNPNVDVTVSFIVGNREFTVTGEDEEDKNSSETLPCPAVFATKVSTGDSGILVPVSFLAQKLGFHYSYHSISDSIILTTTTLFDRDVAVPEYDISLYSNILTTVLLEQNHTSTREELALITANDTTENNVKIEENDSEGIYTYTFFNTYNAVGELQKSFSTSFVKKITVTTSGLDVIVTVSYKNKYSAMTLLEEDGISASFSSSTYSLKVKLPESVKFSQVTDTDQYMKKQFILQIPGDWEEYYQEHPVLANNNVIKNIDITVTSSGKTRITITTKQLQGYRLIEKNGFFTVIVDYPKNIYSNIVVLDAGHGGKDNGATNRGTKEKNLNYAIIYARAKEYFDSQDSNVKAYWTRTNDTFITLSDRARFASEVGADLFISLHMNSCSRPSVNGMEVFYSKNNNGERKSGLTSRILARRMLNKLTGDLKASSRGVKQAGFYVIKHNTVPAVLVELGFLSGRGDYRKLTSAAYQKKAAKSIYQCVESVFKEYPTGRD